MRKKTTSAEYRKRAALLRKFGFHVTLGQRGRKLTGAGKGAVTRKWRQVAHYIENTKQNFEWRKVSKKERQALRAGLPKRLFTPSGLFVRIPKHVKSVLWSVKDDGRVEFYGEALSGGTMREEIYPISAEEIADDPETALAAYRARLAAMRRKPDAVKLLVNGWESPRKELDPEALFNYVEFILLPRLLDPNLDPHYSRAHGGKALSPDEIEETFFLSFQYYGEKTSGKNTKRTKNRGH